MGKVTKTILIFFTICLVLAYGVYFYIVSNLDWKFSGFGVSAENFGSIADKLNAEIKLINNSSFGLKITNFNLKVNNGLGTEVGSIETIRKVSVPARASNEILVEIRNINEAQILKDFTAGVTNQYTYTVSGMLGGFLPIRYKGQAI